MFEEVNVKMMNKLLSVGKKKLNFVTGQFTDVYNSLRFHEAVKARKLH